MQASEDTCSLLKKVIKKHIDSYKIPLNTISQSSTQDIYNTDSQKVKTFMHMFTKATLKTNKQKENCSEGQLC